MTKGTKEGNLSKTGKDRLIYTSQRSTIDLFQSISEKIVSCLELCHRITCHPCLTSVLLQRHQVHS